MVVEDPSLDDLLADDDRADRVFRALADATRRDIVRRVHREELSISAVARAYPMSFAAVQKHVAVLERAGLVTKHRQGREHLIRTDARTIRQAAHLLASLEARWRDRLDRFGVVLAADPEGSTP